MGFKKGGKLHNCHPSPNSLGQDTVRWIELELKLPHPVSNCKSQDCHFKVQNQICDTKVIMNITDPPNCVHYLILEWLLYCVHKSPIS